MNSLKHINKYFIKYKWRLLFGIIFITISNAFGIVPAQYIRKSLNIILETGLTSNSANDLLIYSGLILLMALLRGVFLFFTRQTIIVMSRLIETDLKNEIYNHYQQLPISFYRKNNTGDLMARISEDVSMVRMYIGPGIMYGLNLIVLFALTISYMLMINAKLTFYVLAPLPILSLSIYFVSDRMNKKSTEIQKQLSVLSTFVQEAFSGIRVIKSFVREQSTENTFSEMSENYKQKSLKLTLINSIFLPVIMFLIGLSTILAVYVGGIEVEKGTISVGHIAEFILYVNLLTWPVTSLGWITSIVQRAAASQERINEFLNVKNNIVSGKHLPQSINGSIEFKNVRFTYDDTSLEALKGVSFKIEDGKVLGILGKTGSGKSTIANAICRLYDVSDGEILIDNISINEYDIKFLRQQIGYVPQDVFLFSDTILNNILFGTKNMTLNDAEFVAKKADVHDNIMQFPKGYNTKIGERGVMLSGGQKQRISIARALIKNPSIYIFDDALSAVDTKTENTILENIKNSTKGKTTIMISHRVSTLKFADYIVFLDNGKIIEEGTHDQLFEKQGEYYELYLKQNDNVQTKG